MKLACELGSQVVVPAIRTVVAQEMLSMGVPYSRIAEILGISTTTISKYRARNNGRLVEMIRKDPDLMEDMRTLSRMARDGSASYHHVCEMCHLIRKRFFMSSGKCPMDDEVLPRDG
ncbi:transcriptional regulator [Metallosphaera sedula]|uniref:transcriptional regulator n=1 Tax=Metallosphaera sedula TaxID=43687 RepID=UPI0020BFAF4D|nr:Trp family transcriptional regulator [Metallosphaera sedula]BBL46807.1 transcriptional regulator [Metallosphaera sedula]